MERENKMKPNVKSAKVKGQNVGFGINVDRTVPQPKQNNPKPNVQAESPAPTPHVVPNMRTENFQPQPRVMPNMPSCGAIPMQQYMQPNFQNYVYPTPVIGSREGWINQMVMPNGLPYIPHYNSFADLTTVVPADKENCNTFDAGNLVYEQQVDQYGNTVATADFSSLITQPAPEPQREMFGVQPQPLPNQVYARPSVPNGQNSHISNGNQPSSQSTIPGRKMNNWFTRLLDQKGPDYITSGKLTIDEVSRNAERILDDMIACRIDYTKQGNDIINPIIIETLINYCSNKLAINKAIQFALGYVYNDYTNKQSFITKDPQRYAILNSIDDGLSRNITQAIAIENQDIGIYQILYDRLVYVNASKNASALFSLTTDLNNYKKASRKRY